MEAGQRGYLEAVASGLAIARTALGCLKSGMPFSVPDMLAAAHAEAFAHLA